MYTRFSNSTGVVILLHEIYGINKHIINTANLIEKLGFDVICPNLLNDGKIYNYEEEHEAYQNFKMNVGFEKSTVKVEKLISEYSVKYDKIYLVGFSVGATIAWLCSENPETEKSFHVDELYNKLLQKQCKDIEVYLLNANHGFADPYSKNYNKGAYKRSLHQMSDFLKGGGV